MVWLHVNFRISIITKVDHYEIDHYEAHYLLQMYFLMETGNTITLHSE